MSLEHAHHEMLSAWLNLNVQREFILKGAHDFQQFEIQKMRLHSMERRIISLDIVLEYWTNL